MKDKILGIINKIGTPKDYGDIDAGIFWYEDATTEIESLIKENYYLKEFVEWYVTEGQFEYRFGVGQAPNPLAEALDYWQINIKDK